MGFLRLFLAGSVVLWHAYRPSLIPPFLDGSTAVSAFYVISGFYMQLIITENYSGRKGWALNFYQSRALRIYPTYLVFLIATVLFCAIADRWPWDFRPFVGGALQQFYYVFSNIAIFGQEIGRFGVLDKATGDLFVVANPSPFAPDARLSSMAILQVSWSIAIELWFYLLAPLFLTRRTPSLICIVVIALALRAFLIMSGYSSSEWWNAFLPTEVATFCIGALGYRFYATYLRMRSLPQTKWLIAAVIAYAICFQWLYVLNGPWTYTGFVVLTAVVVPFAFANTRNNRFDRFVGELSYPVYLGQMLLIWLIDAVGVSRAWNGILALLGVIAVAVLVTNFIEKPIANYRHRRFAAHNSSNSAGHGILSATAR